MAVAVAVAVAGGRVGGCGRWPMGGAGGRCAWPVCVAVAVAGGRVGGCGRWPMGVTGGLCPEPQRKSNAA